MPSTQDDEKAPYLDERRVVQDAESDWLPVVAITSAVAACFDPGFGLIPPALASIFIASLKRQGHAIARVLDDPPRRDFTTATKARSRRYRPGQLGSSELAVATDGAVVGTLRVTAYLEAMVRADERAQGAAEAGDLSTAHERAEEVLVFRERARAADADRAPWLDAMSTTWASWAAELNRQEVATPAIPQLPQLALWEALTEAIQQTGLVISDLKLDLPRPPEEAEPRMASEVVVSAARTTRRLARSGEEFFADARTPLAAKFALRRSLHRDLPEQYKRGLEALERGNPAQARQALNEAANLGSTDAMFELGSLSVEMNDWAEAERWFEQARILTRREIRPPVSQMMEVKELPPLDIESKNWIRRALPPELDEKSE